jgi:hypothetical protein
MKNKDTTKKYLKGVTVLFVATLLLSLLIVFALIGSGLSEVDWTVWQRILVSCACAYVPCGAYTGFCVTFLKIDTLSQKQCALFVIFCVPIILFIIVYGIIMLVPTVLKSVLKIILDKS